MACRLASPVASLHRGLVFSSALLLGVRAHSGTADHAGHSPVRAVLFDFDGSLVQSEECHRKSFSAVLGKELDHDTWYTKCVGRSPWDILDEHRHETAPSADELLAQLRAHAATTWDQVEPTQGHHSLLDDLRAARVCMAIVSSGSRAYIERVVTRLGIGHCFRMIVAGDDEAVAGKHKPDPFPYQHAARCLEVDPAHCLAVEDSPSGIKSALSAGMRVIAIRNPANQDHPVLDHPAIVAVVDHFEELRTLPVWDTLMRLVARAAAGLDGRQPAAVGGEGEGGAA